MHPTTSYHLAQARVADLRTRAALGSHHDR
jgi:hypothetical protein